MRNYDRVNPRKPEGIDERKAYIVGGGIAGLSAAAFLVRDAHMPGKNITVYDQLPVFGGSMDSCGNPETGYISRGERELEPYMECLWDLFGSIPSIFEEGRTVLDETRECNRNFRIDTKHRLWDKGFIPHDESSLGLTPSMKEKMMKMMTSTEEELADIKINEWFEPEFFNTNIWYYWASMLAFQPYHSLIEIKRYVVRFMHNITKVEHLTGLLRTKYDQYNSLILPVQKYLVDHGVNFVSGTTVTDMILVITGNEKKVTGLVLDTKDKTFTQAVSEKDFVYFTNGSMTQNSVKGSMTEAPVLNTDMTNRGCFSLWEKLASKSEDFGHPEKFAYDPHKTLFVSFSLTVQEYPELFKYIEKKTGNLTGKGGATTFVTSPWFVSFNAPPQPVFPDQPENVEFLWGYGLHASEMGEYVKKPMIECTGVEILKEFLYQCGLEDKIDEIAPHCTCIPVVMPYITSQFMPRNGKDRPKIIPNGSKNLAFIGQFVELPGDVVFTVETSVRTAMEAVYRTFELDRPITPLFKGQYDIRIILADMKKLMGIQTFGEKKMNPLKMKENAEKLIKILNSVPEMPDFYEEIEQNKMQQNN